MAKTVEFQEICFKKATFCLWPKSALGHTHYSTPPHANFATAAENYPSGNTALFYLRTNIQKTASGYSAGSQILFERGTQWFCSGGWGAREGTQPGRSYSPLPAMLKAFSYCPLWVVSKGLVGDGDDICPLTPTLCKWEHKGEGWFKHFSTHTHTRLFGYACVCECVFVFEICSICVCLCLCVLCINISVPWGTYSACCFPEKDTTRLNWLSCNWTSPQTPPGCLVLVE